MSDSEDWNEWQSDDDNDCEFSAPIIDLFDNKVIYSTSKTFLQKTIEKYNFDLKKFLDDNRLNTYNRIRCVNFIRSTIKSSSGSFVPADLGNVVKDKMGEWRENDDLLMPVLEADGLVQYAAMANHNFDSDDDQFWSDEDVETVEKGEGDDEDAENGMEEALVEQYNINQTQSVQIKMMQRQIEQLNNLLSDARNAFKQYAFEEGGLLSATTPGLMTNHAQPSVSSGSSAPNKANNNDSAQKFGKNDHYYFASYSSRNIHEEMLSDKHRTESYEEAFKQLAPILKGKVVLDVGCGTGILSMFAARHGAKHVIGVDAADIIDKTRDIVVANGFGDRITLVKGKVEEVVLPFDTVDIIVSEWMGYYLLYESMLPSVFYARNKWLRREDTGKSVYEELKDNMIAKQEQTPENTPNSIVDPVYNDENDSQPTRPFAAHTRLLPDVARMYVAGSNARDQRKKKIDFWKNVYGFDMSVMINDLETYPTCEVDIIPGGDIMTSHNMYGIFDLMKDNAKELDFYTQDIKIVVENDDDLVDSFTVWFDTPFTNPSGNVNIRQEGELKSIPYTTPISSARAHGVVVENTIEKMNELDESNTQKLQNTSYNTTITSPQDIILTTAPNMTPTHWNQTIFRLKEVMAVNKGDVINVSIKSGIRKDCHRHYNINITYSFESTKVVTDDMKTGIPHTTFAKPGVVYEQAFALQ